MICIGSKEWFFLNPVNNCHENVWGWKDGGICDERRDLGGRMAAAEQ